MLQLYYIFDSALVEVAVGGVSLSMYCVVCASRASVATIATRRACIAFSVARGRAQVGVHSAKTDWSRRILDFQYVDYDDQAAHQHQ